MFESISSNLLSWIDSSNSKQDRKKKKYFQNSTQESPKCLNLQPKTIKIREIDEVMKASSEKQEAKDNDSNQTSDEDVSTNSLVPYRKDKVDDDDDSDDLSDDFDGNSRHGGKLDILQIDEPVGSVEDEIEHLLVDGAMSIGNFLYNTANSAVKLVSETGMRVKQTIEEVVFSEFNRERESFLRRNASAELKAILPWSICRNEEAVRAACFELSKEKRNFLHDPPPNARFVFNYDLAYPIAMYMMQRDPSLELLRYELVPKIVSEHTFWRNYFYRIDLLCRNAGKKNVESYLMDEYESVKTTLSPRHLSFETSSEEVIDEIPLTERNIVLKEMDNPLALEQVSSGANENRVKESQLSFHEDYGKTSRKIQVACEMSCKSTMVNMDILLGSMEDWETELEREIISIDAKIEDESHTENENLEEELECILQEVDIVQ